MSSTPYVVRAGDYLTDIARRFGTTVALILSAPENNALKKLRPNPEILAPGDVLYIPERETKWLPITLGKTNHFQATVPKVTLRAVLHGPDGKPLAGKAVTTVPPIGNTALSTDGKGLLKVVLPPGTTDVWVVVNETKTRFHLRVGHLDPHDSDTGVISRLRHMGHIGNEAAFIDSRPHLNPIDTETIALTAAVRSFQATSGKDATGLLDNGLRRAIRDAHGC